MDKEVDKWLFKFPRFMPAILGLFAFSVSLLFLKELELIQKSFLTPALLVYSQGAAILGFINRMLGFHYIKPQDENYEKCIPLKLRIFLWIMHIFWFFLFIYYLFYRGVL